MTEYECFLREKEVRAEDAGFEAKELIKRRRPARGKRSSPMSRRKWLIS